MKKQDPLDTNMLMIHGLLDNPTVVQQEKDRLAWEEKRKNIEEMAERLMDIDQNLDDLLMAVAAMHAKEGVAK